MPINPVLRKYYPPNWKEISNFVRFTREKGRCQSCGRYHGNLVHQLNDGRWFDNSSNLWRDKRGKPTAWPDMFEFGAGRYTKVFLAAAHIDHDPRINGNEQYDRVAAWCQKCHLNNDRPYHIRRRRLLIKSRYARGDLFMGDYSNVELSFISESDSTFRHVVRT
jgi:hypothetical protein